MSEHNIQTAIERNDETALIKALEAAGLEAAGHSVRAAHLIYASRIVAKVADWGPPSPTVDLAYGAIMKAAKAEAGSPERFEQIFAVMPD